MITVALLSAAVSATPGDPVEAWITGSSTAASAALQDARVALTRGRPSEALSALREVVDDPLGRWLAARAWKRLDAAPKALESLGPLPEGRCLNPAEDPVQSEPALLRAQLLFHTDPEAADAAFTSLKTAEGLSAALRLTADRKLERRLLLEHAGSPEARARIRKLGFEGILERFEELEDRVSLAEALLAAHENQSAARVARKIVQTLPAAAPERCRLGYVLGRAARKLRAYGRAAATLRTAKQFCLQKAHETTPNRAMYRDRAVRSALLEAQVLSIRGRRKALSTSIAWLTENFPQHSYIDDALLWSAELRRGQDAETEFRKVVALEGDQAPAAAWQLARAALTRTKLEEARRWLETILELPEADVDDRERAEFFLGRSYAKAAPRQAARRWAQLAGRPSFYGFLALDRLKKTDPELGERVAGQLIRASRAPRPLKPSAAVLEHPTAQRAARWYRAGATEWAEAELRNLACTWEAPSPTETVTLAHALTRLGARPAAQRLLRWDARNLLQQPLEPGSAAVWRAAYSLAFAEEFVRAATSEGLDPLLMTALAREESQFDPKVVSWAGATGLAQLMPATAVGAHVDVFGSSLTDLNRLVEPELNLRLGARVLKDALLFFEGFEPFALSAYNGGAGLTQKTLPRRAVSFESWVEGNPVKENRRYVKRVMATWGIYRLFYDLDKPFITFPKTIGPGSRVRF